MLCRMGNPVISARKQDIGRENAGSLKNGKRRTPIRNPGEPCKPIVVTIPAPQFHVIIAGKRVLYHGNVGENGGTRGGHGGGQMADMAKSMAAMQEVLKKLVPEAVFP